MVPLTSKPWMDAIPKSTKAQVRETTLRRVLQQPMAKDGSTHPSKRVPNREAAHLELESATRPDFWSAGALSPV